MNRLFFPVFLLFLMTTTISWTMDLPTRQIVDDSLLRRSLLDTWFRESPVIVMARQPEIHNLRGGGRVQVRADSSGTNQEEFAIVLAREQNGTFPGWVQGSWVLTRRLDNNLDGSRIRIFLRSDFNTYVQFRPFGSDRSLMDVVIYDGYVIRAQPLPFPFERLLVLPVEDILAEAGSRFPRNYFEPDPGIYRDTREFVRAVRERLPELRFGDDGAIDENGQFVFINNLASQSPSNQGLNCSGFAKWIVDGLLRPLTGQRLSITPLKQPFGDRGASFTEPWEELRDPFFGLDWTRNLASIAWTTLRSPVFSTLEEFEVRSWNITHLIERRPGGSVVTVYPGFVEPAGFAFDGLHALMYSLAIDEPNRIFLAAINNELPARQIIPPRSQPRIRAYFHIAALVPFFNENGVFQVVVFESAAETSFARFRTRYPEGHFVNLVRIPVEGRFEP